MIVFKISLSSINIFNEMHKKNNGNNVANYTELKKDFFFQQEKPLETKQTSNTKMKNHNFPLSL